MLHRNSCDLKSAKKRNQLIKYESAVGTRIFDKTAKVNRYIKLDNSFSRIAFRSLEFDNRGNELQFERTNSQI